MAAALPFISTAFGVIGAIQQSNAMAASEKSNQYAAEWNAERDRQKADLALKQGNMREEAQRREARKAAGLLRAGLVENGLGLDSGTSADLVEESSLNAEMDALNIRYDAQLNASGYRDSALMNDQAAASAKSRASQAKQSGFWGAASSVLTGVGNYYKGQADQKVYDAQLKYYSGD